MNGLNILIKAFMISEFYGSVTIIGSQLLLGVSDPCDQNILSEYIIILL